MSLSTLVSAPLLLSKADAASFLGISVSTLDRLVKQKLIPATRDGKKFVKFQQSDLQAYKDFIQSSFTSKSSN